MEGQATYKVGGFRLTKPSLPGQVYGETQGKRATLAARVSASPGRKNFLSMNRNSADTIGSGVNLMSYMNRSSGAPYYREAIGMSKRLMSLGKKEQSRTGNPVKYKIRHGKRIQVGTSPGKQR